MTATCSPDPLRSRRAPGRPSRSLRDNAPRHWLVSVRRVPAGHGALCAPQATLLRGSPWASREPAPSRRACADRDPPERESVPGGASVDAASQGVAAGGWNLMQGRGVHTVSTWLSAWASARGTSQRTARSPTAFWDGHAVSRERRAVLGPWTWARPSRPGTRCGVPEVCSKPCVKAPIIDRRGCLSTIFLREEDVKIVPGHCNSHSARPRRAFPASECWDHQNPLHQRRDKRSGPRV